MSGTKAKVPHLDPKARVVAHKEVRGASVAYVAKCEYRQAKFGGHFLLPAGKKTTTNKKKRQVLLFVDMKWFGIHPNKMKLCRITCLTEPQFKWGYTGTVVANVARPTGK
jgi:hypothetical protein